LLELNELAVDEPNSFVDGPFGSDMKTSDYVDAGVPLIRIQNVRPNQFLSKEIRYISEAKARQLARHEYRPGDLVITKLGEPCGVACVVPESAGTGVIVADIVRFRGDKRRVDHRYLSHYINSPTAASWVAREAKGTTRQRVNLSNFRRLPVPLPSLPEQRRIAEVLDKADALRAKRRAALAQLDTLTQSIFLDMFGDPATNPKGWPIKQLAELVRGDDTINYGVVQPGDETEGGVPLVRVGDLVEGKVRRSGLKRIAPSIEAAYRRSRLRGDEILISCVGSIGVVALADESVKGFNIARAVARIPLADTMNRLFVAAYLVTDHVQRYFVNELRTVSQPTLNIKQISETAIVTPPIEMQLEFARRVSAVQKLGAAHRQFLAEMDALFGSLQHRVFGGAL